MYTHPDLATPPHTQSGGARIDGNLPAGMVEVTVDKASELDDALAGALKVVQQAATQHRTGILVTRIEAGSYIVRAHPAVPFGLIRESHS